MADREKITGSGDFGKLARKHLEAMEVSIDGMAISSPDGKYVYMNPAHAEIYGYDSPEELLGKTWQILYDREHIAWFEEKVIPILRETGHWHGESVGRRKDGSKFPQEVSLSVLEGGWTVCIVRDITKRREVEEALRASDESMKALLNATDDIALLVDTNGKILALNEKAAEGYGGRPEELLGTLIYDHIPPEIADVRRQRIEIILKTKKPLFAEDHIRGRIYNVTVYPVLNDRGEVARLGAFTRDITIQKRAIEKILQTQKFMRNILDSMPFGVIIIDRNKRIMQINRSALNTMGYDSPESIINKKCHDVLCPADKHKCPILDLGRELDRSERTLLTREGRSIDILKSVIPITIDDEEVLLEAFVDISERKKVVEELRKSENLFRTVVETVRDVIFLLDKDQRYQGIWGKWLDDYNLSPDLYLGKTSWEIFGQETRPFFEQINNKVLAGEVQDYERWFDLPWGRVFYHTTLTPVRDGSGKIIGIVGLSRDLTDRKTSEDALARAKEDLEKQNIELMKLDEIKDGLIKDVSHELKTPVAKQIMQLDILKDLLGQEALEGQTRELIESMGANLSRLENIIKNILTLSRLEAGGRKYESAPVRLDTVIEEVIEDNLLALNTYGINVKTHLARVTIQSDREMLWHVFSNLLNNAIKYRATGDHPKLKISMEKAHKEIRVTFADNGIGLSKIELERAFDRFYQARHTSEGAGLGLAIARSIVESLGGRIWLKSKGRNKGVTATVALPI